MEKIETLQEFYKRKFNWISESIHYESEHFNVFKFDPQTGLNTQPIPYKKRDYFKVVMMTGHGKVHLANKIVEVKKNALIFSNPQVRSKWEQTSLTHRGFFCVFNQGFLRTHWVSNQYSVFQPQGKHVFELTGAQVDWVSGIYGRMLEEINSEYIHKYDVLRNLVMELVHLGMKMSPGTNFDAQPINASQRITMLFMELLESQFSSADLQQPLRFRSPSDFANQLNVHVNHLNRSIKEATQKTTSQIIGERISYESKLLLRHSGKSVSEIARIMGFPEVSRFNNFFKKQVKTSPLKFRNKSV